MGFRKSIVSILVLALACTACSNTGSEKSSNSTDTTIQNTQNQSQETTSQLTASFVAEDGSKINTADLKGKVVFINFWATWCPPCVKEMPSIQTLYNTYKQHDNVVFLIVEIESNIAGTKEFLKKENLTLPVVYPESEIPENWLSGAIPSTVILDKSGNLATRYQGMHDFSTKEMEDYIQKLVSK